MAHMLLFERDAGLRRLLRMLLRADYALTEVSDLDDALTMLRESAEPLVAVVGDWPPGASGERVLRIAEHDADLRRHVYILVSTNHDDLAPAFRALLARLSIPVVPMPSDLRVLQEAVRDAHARVDRQRGGAQAGG